MPGDIPAEMRVSYRTADHRDLLSELENAHCELKFSCVPSRRIFWEAIAFGRLLRQLWVQLHAAILTEPISCWAFLVRRV